MSATTTGGILVIGYGNELRGDDAIGPQVARKFELRNLARVRTLAVHQLTPELAEEIAAADGVIFVDAQACSSAADVAIEQLGPADTANLMTHALQPRTLLAMSQLLYGRAPPAWLVAVPGSCFEMGSRMSHFAAGQAERAVEKIHQLIRHLEVRI
jgi:hydrogenase maturation protease